MHPEFVSLDAQACTGVVHAPFFLCLLCGANTGSCAVLAPWAATLSFLVMGDK